ncbi:integrase [Psychrobacter sp. Sarcosine-02u-2]|uniref:site-specific integrase n=1 Tax=Psychrobacter sp. Sarcosine-02u-2 TaxID=2058324 RepID=UPI000C79E297|nr:site-specific integrase [Psychrobacter sp. Sarcosine-02u-2]PKG88383.1 integrase [Psychrobacter sp. Sarcosine-02u-2]
MANTNLALQFPDYSSHRLFSEAQISKIESLHIPTVIRFMLADRHETKFINSTSSTWEFLYSGRKEYIDFTEEKYLDKHEIKLLKFFLAYYSQLNSPAYLSKHFKQVRSNFQNLIKSGSSFSYVNFREILLDLAVDESKSREYYTLKNFVRFLIAEGFEGFSEEDELDLEILERPKTFNSKLYYQEIEDPISRPTVTMIQNGFAKLNSEITKRQSIADNVIKNASILGLIYVTGMRPVQLSKLSVEDIKIDTYTEEGEHMRYSILVPYAKQGRFNHAKISIKLPEEIATVILQYIKQFKLPMKHQLFNLGNSAVTYCTTAINEQIFRFSPQEYQKRVLSSELIQIKYTSSQFRHHVAHSMALSGSSAEEIAYVLGHSSLVTARYYIFSSPNLAQTRAIALGRNPVYQQIIAMLMTGDIITHEQDHGKNIIGFINNKIHINIGKCNYKANCFLEPVRSCYGCVYFHPYEHGHHEEVLECVQDELESIIHISDAVYNSSNPIISIHEATKFEIQSVIKRCKLNSELKNADD